MSARRPPPVKFCNRVAILQPGSKFFPGRRQSTKINKSQSKINKTIDKKYVPSSFYLRDFITIAADNLACLNEEKKNISSRQTKNDPPNKIPRRAAPDNFFVYVIVQTPQ